MELGRLIPSVLTLFGIFALAVLNVHADRGEENAKVLKDFIETHCRVVSPGATMGTDSTVGVIKCDK